MHTYSYLHMSKSKYFYTTIAFVLRVLKSITFLQQTTPPIVKRTYEYTPPIFPLYMLVKVHVCRNAKVLVKFIKINSHYNHATT